MEPTVIAPSDQLSANTPTPDFTAAITTERVTTLPGLLRGLTYQTPTIGNIRIGSTTEVDGQILPIRDDEFSVTTRFRGDDGEWIEHAIEKTLRGKPEHLVNSKLRRIPVKVIYDNPNLNMSEQYAAFSADQRPVCVGNGSKAKRAVLNGGIESVQCEGPALCVYGRDGAHSCATLARAVFQIEGQSGCESAFMFRTSSYNSVNDMRVRLQSLQAGYGGKLAGLPMWLEMHLKSSSLSHDRAFFYVSLEPRFEDYPAGAKHVQEKAAEEAAAGFDRASFEAAMSLLLANGDFTEDFADVPEFVDLLAGRAHTKSRTAGASTSKASTGNFDAVEFSALYETKPAGAAKPTQTLQ